MNITLWLPIQFYHGNYVARYLGKGKWLFFTRYRYRFLRRVPVNASWRKKVVRLFWPVMVAIAAEGAA